MTSTIIESKLVRLFVTLQEQEMTNFVRAWRKKQHYEGTDGVHLYRLFEYLKKYYSNENKLGKEKVFSYIYKNIPFSSKGNRTLNLLLSKANPIVEQYIIQLQLDKEEKNNHLQKQMIMIRYLKQQLSDAARAGMSNERLYDRYYRTIEKLYEKVLKNPVKDIFAYLDVYTLSHLLYYNVDLRRIDKGKITMETLVDSLDKFLYVAKLKYGCEIGVRQRIWEEEIDAGIMGKLNFSNHQTIESDDTLLQFYERYHKLISNDQYDEAAFKNLRDFTFEKIADLSFDEGENVLGLLMNYTSWASRYKHATADISLSLYRFIFQEEYFIDQGLVHPMLLINYCFYCSKLGYAYEIPAILNRYIEQVKSDKRAMTEKLCQAHKNFAEGKYEEVYTELLTQGPLPDSMFFLSYRCLKIKSLYMLGGYSIDENNSREPHQEAENYIIALEKSNYNKVVKESNTNFASLVSIMSLHKQTKKELRASILQDHCLSRLVKICT